MGGLYKDGRSQGAAEPKVPGVPKSQTKVPKVGGVSDFSPVTPLSDFASRRRFVIQWRADHPAEYQAQQAARRTLAQIRRQRLAEFAEFTASVLFWQRLGYSTTAAIAQAGRVYLQKVRDAHDFSGGSFR